ncbi:MAG: alcohol dehydrogenase catalytic domain-containing protein [Caldilineaceae bacterium]|nr:alcohol dehydrogenase catalytic domain-containing protein [Caldilineaceae bacterium]
MAAPNQRKIDRFDPGNRPAVNLSWPLRGIGLAALGVDGEPVVEPFPVCGDDEILVRVDAVGICSTDVKIMRLGGEYPPLRGRDLAADPLRLGHEVALTVLEVGARWQGRYHPGQRLGLQPDVFLGGVRSGFGAVLPGAFTQFLTLGPTILDGDHGSYVFPAADGLSYADIALLEPWACVESSYRPRRRLYPRRGGVLWIVGQPGDRRDYHCSLPCVSGTVILSGAPPSLMAWASRGSALIVAGGPFAPSEIDDVILIDPTPAQVEEALTQLAPQGTINLVDAKRLDHPLPVDVARVHYEFIGIMGAPGPDVAAAYGPIRNRSDLRPGGVLWVVGAGGAMGRMHIGRALRMADGPRAVIATNRGEERLADLRRSFTGMAAAHGRTFHALSPVADGERLAATIDELTGGRGVDDIVVVAPNLDAMIHAVDFLAADGLISIFAGLPLGNLLPLPLGNVYRHAMQITGTSASFVADQLAVMEKSAAGELSPAQAVTAICGMRALAEAMRAVADHRYAGRVLIYPQLVELPLLGFSELERALPQVHAQLIDGAWSAAAERVIFESFRKFTAEDTASRRD